MKTLYFRLSNFARKSFVREYLKCRIVDILHTQEKKKTKNISKNSPSKIYYRTSPLRIFFLKNISVLEEFSREHFCQRRRVLFFLFFFFVTFTDRLKSSGNRRGGKRKREILIEVFFSLNVPARFAFRKPQPNE